MELFQTDTAQAIGLLSTRLSGLLLVAPLFSSRAVPMRIRTGVLLLLTLVLLPDSAERGRGTAPEGCPTWERPRWARRPSWV